MTISYVKFTVPGEVRGKGRPRFGRTKGGATVTFTDKATASYENLIRVAAYEAMAGQAPMAEPVRVDVTVRLCPPTSWSRKAKASCMSGDTAVTGRFDLDNTVKAILDGINTVVFADDRQVVELNARKVASAAPGVDVIVTPYRTPDRSAA